MSSPMLNTAMKAARAACTILNRAVDNLSTLEVHKKGHSDYVSEVDVACERTVVEILREAYPRHQILGEENGLTGPEKSEFQWIIDPLDGTSNYIHDNAPYCVSIALRDRTEVLLGVVYECCRDELFWACKGGKAFLNGKEIHVSDVSVLDQAFIELGFPYKAGDYREFALQLIRSLYGHVGGLRLIGAAAAELCYIAAGRFEARIEAFIGPWDIAAGHIILKQAGGRMTDFSGNPDPLDAREVFASNGRVHEEILQLLKTHKGLLGQGL